MKIKYSALSPYFSTTVVGDYLDLMRNRPIPRFSDDIIFKINSTYQYRPDLLAHDLYGDSRLWWVFAQRNPNTLVDPLFDFKEGTEIWLPKLDILKKVLGF
jgi:hypothetical protein